MLPSTSGVSGGRLQPGHAGWRPRRSAAPCCSSAAGGGPSNSSSGGGSSSSSTSGGGASWLQQQLSAAGRRAGAALLAAALAAAPLAPLALPPPPPAAAVTNEQLLFLEAWRAVDRAYVDKSFNGQSWFRVSGWSWVIVWAVSVGGHAELVWCRLFCGHCLILQAVRQLQACCRMALLRWPRQSSACHELTKV